MKIDGQMEILDPGRRTFLKASSMTVLGAAVPLGAEAASRQSSEEHPDLAGSANSRVEMVNILQGTDSTFYFSRGNSLPIAAMPFGMVHWTLQSRSNTPWMFQPGDRRVQGFRATHQLSPWLSDYGQAIFLPCSGEVDPDPQARASSYRPEDAKLFPHSIRLRLLRYRIDAELIPTERCCLLTAFYEQQQSRCMVIDVPGKDGEIHPREDQRILSFQSKTNAGGVPDNFATYYTVHFPEAWEHIEIRELNDRRVAIIRFQPATENRLEARIATSFISHEQAERNLERELGQNSADQLRTAAAARWNEHLGRIEIEGASERDRRTFYSCFYRALLFPRIWHEVDANGNNYHFSAFNGRVMPGVMYADHGYWDLYRAWYPLMSILFPERLGEILQAWVNAYKEGGWLPQFPAPGYRACMTGSLIDAVFADAAVKGIPGFNLQDAYEGMKKHATQPGDPAKGYGRVGIEYYLRGGYIPADRIQQSVAETADAAYGDFCIAQIAALLNKREDQQAFLQRSKNWHNLFDSQVKFLRGKNEDGSWLTPFDPATWGSPYVEGAAWQHRWDTPHDIPALIEAMGGKKAAADALEQMLMTPPIFNTGVYGMEIHEMSEMAAVPFGQYAHSNQPVHHLLYIFSHADRPDRTQYWVRKVLTELYSPDTFPGDEDTGSMSAWFILSALGFYSVCPGKAEYTLGSPLFSRAIVHLSGGNNLRIEAPGNNEKTPFVRSVSMNGSTLSGPTIDHATLVKGGTLRFAMATQ